MHQWIIKAAGLHNKMLELAIMLDDTRKLREILPAILILSAVVMALRSLVFCSLFHAFGAEVGLMDCLSLLPLVFLLLMITVTIGGLGVREGALWIFFSSVRYEISVSVGLAQYVRLLLISLPGAFIWLVHTPSSRSHLAG